MRASTNVYFEHELESPYGDQTLSVCATISAYYPAVRHLRNGDPGYPEEGGEVEDLSVVLPDGSEMHQIPEALYNELVEIAQDKAESEYV